MSYTYVWEFQVSRDLEPDFERHYGPEGSWSQLFRQSSGYVETLLLKDKSINGRYLTLDRWRHESAFLSFRSKFSKQYEQLDQEMSNLTTGERPLGQFSECAA